MCQLQTSVCFILFIIDAFWPFALLSRLFKYQGQIGWLLDPMLPNGQPNPELSGSRRLRGTQMATAASMGARQPLEVPREKGTLVTGGESSNSILSFPGKARAEGQEGGTGQGWADQEATFKPTFPVHMAQIWAA